jgi:hypothetical protein
LVAYIALSFVYVPTSSAFLLLIYTNAATMSFSVTTTSSVWRQPNPNVTTREVWINAKLDYDIPADAAPEFRSYVEMLQSLERKLGFHTAM